MIGIEFMMLCAPNVAPQTIEQIITVESSGNPLAINVNKGRLARKPSDAADAAALARDYIAKGYSVDLGLMQVNSRNLPRLGYSVEDMFEPCKNIAAGARVLTAFYAAAKPKYADEQSALRAALSAYNTGNFVDGFTNGYLAKFGLRAGQPIAATSVPALNAYTAETAVFVRQLQQQKENAMNSNAVQAAQASTSAVRADAVVSRAQQDMATAGVQVEYTATEADTNGAFEETALSEADAWAANADLAADPNATAIVVGGKAIRASAPATITKANGQAPATKPEGE